MPTSFLNVNAHGGAKTLSIQPSAIAGNRKFQIGAIIEITSLFSILSLWFKTTSSGFSPAKTGLNFSLYKSTQSTSCPLSLSDFIKVSLIAALNESSL